MNYAVWVLDAIMFAFLVIAIWGVIWYRKMIKISGMFDYIKNNEEEEEA